MNSDIITISRAKIADLENILNLFVNSINSVCAKDYSMEQREAWTASAKNTKRWKNKLKTQYFLVARKQGLIIGFASLENDEYIDLLFVHSEFQGWGIATLLFEKLQKQAVKKHVKQLTANVSLTARPFFEKMDFKVLEEQHKPIRGVNLINYRMQKMLT